MPARIKDLSAAEWEIMNTVWALDRPVSVRDVLEAAYPNDEKAYTTVQTLMNILVEKGVLGRRKTGLVNYYAAAVGREEAVRLSLSTAAQRMFNGSFGAMASFLVSSSALRQEDVAALKRLLDEHGG